MGAYLADRGTVTILRIIKIIVNEEKNLRLHNWRKEEKTVPALGVWKTA